MWTDEEYNAFNEFIHDLLYETMTDDDYEMIMRHLGAKNRGDRYTTICHNLDGGNYNLAFNRESRSFTCFSECGCSYSLLSLIKKRRELVGLPCSTYQSLKWLCDELGIALNFKEKVQQTNTNIYNWKGLLKYTKNGSKEVELQIYDKHILEYFKDGIYEPWIDYGITIDVMLKYNIGWYNYRQQITIPCYDEFGNLIGIRIRNTNPMIETKYKPLQLLDGTEYNFPTNEVFFGENWNLVNVERTHSVILVEAEKTVMKYESWYGAENNICLGLYGSNLSQQKLKKLLRVGCENFYIALDSDFNEIGDADYKKFEDKVLKIYNLIKPYSNNIYVVYNNLGYKDSYKFSITDFTKEQFEKLWESKERIEVYAD